MLGISYAPKWDPGGDLGAAMGQGAGNILNLLTRKAMTKKAAEQIKGLDFKNPEAFAENMSKVYEATAHIPGGSQFFETMGPLVQKQMLREQMRNFAGGGGQGTPSPAQVTEDTPGPSMQESRGVGGMSPARAQTAGMAQDRSLTPEPTGDVPRAEENRPFGLLTPEEKQMVFNATIDDPAKFPQALAELERNKIQQQEQLYKQMQERRAMESERAQNVEARTNELLRQKGLSEDAYWRRQAYNQFEAQRAKAKPGTTEEQLWNDTERQLERQIADLSRQKSTMQSPRFRESAETRANSIRSWVQNSLRAYGNDQDTRRFYQDFLQSQGFTADESALLVQPITAGFRDMLKKMPEVRKLADVDIAPGLKVRMPEKETPYLKPQLEKLPLALKSIIQPTDSLLAMKAYLVRDKGFSDQEVAEAFIKAQEGPRGLKLTESQIAELPALATETRPNLFDVLGQNKRVIEWWRPLGM